MCLFIGELSPILFGDIKNQGLIIPVIFGGSACVSLLWGLMIRGYLLLVFLWVQLDFLSWSFSSMSFFMLEFVDNYCLNLGLSYNIMFSPSMVI